MYVATSILHLGVQVGDTLRLPHSDAKGVIIRVDPLQITVRWSHGLPMSHWDYINTEYVMRHKDWQFRKGFPAYMMLPQGV